MARRRILVINPNTSKSMTKSLDDMIKQLDEVLPFSAEIETYTATKGPASVNNQLDCVASADTVHEELSKRLKHGEWDGVLVACYSRHPLVEVLQDYPVHVTGIFEASILTALSLLQYADGAKFGIVSTGSYWGSALSEGVRKFLDMKDLGSGGRFKGVETTGLNAIELHSAPAEEVKAKMMEATRRLVKDRDVRVVCLGCAGMVGLEGIVREALVAELGELSAKRVYIVDGVKAGIGQLESLIRALPKE